ncbi:hypothetical protein B1F79_05385 [Coxiella-like endosymbiont of Rhipicephalus sanguineus]|uniref:hypothetical protein n=1 Tax=Coxiella-like endosymbiont of Rhipicephalus sanguineus TaxID=1955402 RepID=UPI00203F940C|nr:hypothetical protein [Coxiella-like endosymbiont of Rhipicephalus sanguineus]MBT8506812.1 hypothetical protein [Coxiella-like endosymbiont of Rhipicephalus sanguineus]
MDVIDAALALQAAATTTESLDYEICMIGTVRNHMDILIEKLKLPDKIIPIIDLYIGYLMKKNKPLKSLLMKGIFSKDKYNKTAVE